MMQCLDQRREEKIYLERVLLDYKLQVLENKSVAERSQLHSQYFQTVRAVRDRKLEEVGEQWYQIQRDRRGWEGGANVSDFTYKFPTRRSQQITQQTAYNLEVSILSGMAKYVGFPAAPCINGARPAEVDEDFQNMGVRAPIPKRDLLYPNTDSVYCRSKRNSKPPINIVSPHHYMLHIPQLRFQCANHQRMSSTWNSMLGPIHITQPISTFTNWLNRKLCSRPNLVIL